MEIWAFTCTFLSHNTYLSYVYFWPSPLLFLSHSWWCILVLPSLTSWHFLGCRMVDTILEGQHKGSWRNHHCSSSDWKPVASDWTKVWLVLERRMQTIKAELPCQSCWHARVQGWHARVRYWGTEKFIYQNQNHCGTWGRFKGKPASTSSGSER